jgi:hypothetical protein
MSHSNRRIPKRAQQGVDSRLVALALRFEPLQYILIDAQGMVALVGVGCRPRRTTPRTMRRTAITGCSSVGFAGADLSHKRAQSVLDCGFAGVDVRFAARGFAEGDEVDFMVYA